MKNFLFPKDFKNPVMNISPIGVILAAVTPQFVIDYFDRQSLTAEERIVFDLEYKFFSYLMDGDVKHVTKMLTKNPELANSTLPDKLYHKRHGKYTPSSGYFSFSSDGYSMTERKKYCWFKNDCFQGCNALQVAIEIRDEIKSLSIFKVLLTAGGIIKNHRNNDGFSQFTDPYMRILKKGNSLEFLHAIFELSPGSTLTPITDYYYAPHNSPSVYCVKRQKYDDLKLLLEHGLETKFPTDALRIAEHKEASARGFGYKLSVSDKTFCPALDLAVKNNMVEFVELLS